MKKILVPYDGSEPAEKAIRYVINMVEEKEHHSKRHRIILVHVIPEMPVPPMFESMIRSRRTGEVTTIGTHYKAIYHEMKDAASKKLEAKKSDIEWQLKGREEISVEVKIMIGNPADKILGIAEDEMVDLIVIGNVSLKGLARLKALGSVSRKVTERASCPVVIVR